MLSVDFGPESIQVVKFRNDRNGQWRLQDWLEIPQGNGGVGNAPRRRWRTGWRGSFFGVRRRQAVTCVSACDVMVREVVVPSALSGAASHPAPHPASYHASLRASHQELRDVLNSENLFPQPLSELCVDYRQIAQVNQDSVRLSLAAAPREVVEERIRQLAAIGLRPAAMLVDAFALQHLLDHDPQRPLETDTSQLFILVDAGQFSLYVLQAGKLMYTRRHTLKTAEVAVAAREIARAVQLFAVSSAIGGEVRLILAGSHPALAALSDRLAATCGLAVQVLNAGAVVAHSSRPAGSNGAGDGAGLHCLALAFAMVISVAGDRQRIVR